MKYWYNGDQRDRAVFDYLLKALNSRNLAYLHLGIFDDAMEFDYLGGSASAYLRSIYKGTLVGVGSYTAESGAEAIQNQQFDLLAIGRPFIANPDYVEKVQAGQAVKEYDESMLATLD